MPGWVRKIFLGVGILILIASFSLIFIHTDYAKQKIASYLQNYVLKNYNIKSSVASLDYKLLPPLVVRLNDLKIYGGRSNSQDFLSSHSLEVIIPYSSFWGNNFLIRRLTLESPSMSPENLPVPKFQKTSSGTFQIDQIDITGGDLRYSQFRVQDMYLNAAVLPDSIQLKKLWARLKDFELNANGVVHNLKSPIYDLTYQIAGNAKSISALFPQVPPLEGQMTTSGKVHGANGFYAVNGQLDSQSLSVNGQPGFKAHARYQVDSSNQRAPYSIALTWDSLPLAIAKRFAPQAPPLASISTGSFDYSGPADYWKGEGKFRTTLRESAGKGLRLAGDIHADISGGRVNIADSVLNLAGAHTTFAGSITRANADLKINADIPRPANFAFLVPSLTRVPGAYNIRSTVRGPFDNLQIDYSLNGHASDFQLASTGTFFSGTKQFQAQASGNAQASVLHRYSDTNASGQIAFNLTASGTPSAPVLHALVQGHSLSVNNNAIGDLNLQADSDGKTLQAVATLPQFSTTANATYAFRTAQFQLNTQFQNLSVDQLRPFLPATASNLSGNITGQLTASGNAKRWRAAQAQLTVQQAQFQQQNLQASIASGSTVVLKNQIATVNLGATLPQGNLQVQGQIPISNRGVMDVHATGKLDLSMISLVTNTVVASGTLAMDVFARGSIRNPKITGTIASNQFTASMPQQKIDLTAGSIQAQLAGNQATIHLAAALNGSPFQADGTVPFDRAGNMNVHITGQADLKLLAMVTDQVQGTGTIGLNVNLTGPVMHPSYTGSIRSDQFSVTVPDKQITLTQGRIAADFTGDQLRLNTSANLNGSSLQVNGTIALKEAPGEIHLVLTSFPVSSLSTDSGLAGTVTVKLDAQGRGLKPAAWSGLLTVLPQDLRMEDTAIRSDQPIRVQLTSGMAELMPVRIQGGDLLDVSAQGKVDFRSGQIDARLRSTGELALLSRFTTKAQGSGTLVANVNVSGTLTQPDISGVVRLDNGVFRVPQSPVLLERIQLVAPIRSDRITFETLQANMGGGLIRGGGTVSLNRWKPDAVQLWVKANEVGMRYPEDLRSQLSADVTFNSQAASVYLLAGKVQIVRSTFRQDIDPTQRLVNTLLSEKRTLSPPSATGTRIMLDLSVDTIDDFQMRNNLAKLQAAANLRITGSTDLPRISGRLRIRTGSEITFQGNTFEVRRGTIDFYGKTKMDPVFDLELFTLADDVDTRQEYEITLPLSGPLSKLDDRDPTSYPPLSSNQIYFLLLTGHADAQVSQASSRFFQQQMASFLAGQAFSGLERQLANAFGLQRVEIQPEMISSETSPGAKLVLGKDFSHSFSLLYSVSLTEAREQTWVASYRARRNFTFRFIDQQNGSYGINVRHLSRFGPGVSGRSLQPRKPTVRYVENIRINNQSSLSDAEVQKIIKLQSGDKYDFWNVQDSLEKVETKLQDMGYLFPQAELQQTAAGTNSFNVEINISGRGKRSVLYRGYQPTKHQLDKYRRFWREGFSEEGVLEIIREDLLRGLWFQGYHKAEVLRETTKNDQLVQHVFTVTPGPIYKTATFVFHGATNYQGPELEEDLQKLYPDRKEMVTDGIHAFNSMRDKILALYLQKGYIDAQVEKDDTKYLQTGIVEKDIQIVEGPQSKITDIEISDGIQFPADLQTKLHMKVGAVYDPQLLNADELQIGEYYETKGYRKFQIQTETRKADHGGLIIDYDIKTGGVAHVDSIQITGNSLTDRGVIEKRLALKSGDVLTQDKLAAAQKNLNDLRIFHSATVKAEETNTPDRYDVTVNVIEIRTYELQYGFRYDTDTSLGAEAQLTNLNLFGTAQQASFYTRISKNNQLYRTTYHSPTLAGLHWKNLVSASYENGDLFLRESDQFGLAEGQRFEFLAQRQRELWHPFILVVNYDFQRLRTRLATAAPGTDFDRFKISLLGSQIFADTRDDPINAHHGRFVSFDFQWAPSFLISDVNYVRLYAQYLNFQPLGRRMLWASAIRLGLASTLDPHLITERFLAGGSYTIRGFKTDQVGPKDAMGNPAGGEAMFVFNQEMRVPIYKWISGVAFYDAGNVYLTAHDFNPFRLRHSVGFGLRVDSPFGIVRGDIGFNLFRRADEPRYVLHFGIGQAF